MRRLAVWATVVTVGGACRGPEPTEARLLQDLPLLEFPAAPVPAARPADVASTEPSGSAVPGATLAVFLSGDGGWAALPTEVTRRLQAAGVSVVGLDSRRYLEEVRNGEDVARDVARIVGTYARAWSAERVALVGFSRGANLAAFAAAGLPESTRAGLAGVVLLAPGSHEKFRFRLPDLLRTTAGTAGTPVAPAVRRIAPVPVWCVNGRAERVRVCEAVRDTLGVTVLLREGGHHLDRDYDALGTLVLEVMDAKEAGGA